MAEKSSTTRRAVFAGAVALPVAAVLPRPAVASPHSPLTLKAAAYGLAVIRSQVELELMERAGHLSLGTGSVEWRKFREAKRDETNALVELMIELGPQHERA